ncbi:hypothetical protein GUJ93_ZPchr0009g634 [Zizania palustris]|uniref:Uncharacterized protein n=1 Tax=Zizania palustris TaxID=103762 RepID=A0A8J5VKU4_ZIZPA|nr:hypothetical protein GUJ93_ZPchr0009g634 [Zizania palustris]
MAANGGGALLERRSSVRWSQSMVLEDDRGPPADEEHAFRSQGSNEPSSSWARSRSVWCSTGIAPRPSRGSLRMAVSTTGADLPVSRDMFQTILGFATERGAG